MLEVASVLPIVTQIGWLEGSGAGLGAVITSDLERTALASLDVFKGTMGEARPQSATSTPLLIRGLCGKIHRTTHAPRYAPCFGYDGPPAPAPGE